MAGLDVSDAFDGNFLDTFDIIRREETVGDDGFATKNVTTDAGQYGVVTMASPNDLQRLPEADVSLKTIIIVTMARLQLASKTDDPEVTIKADIVLWAGDYYQVSLVDDYSRYGQGYIWAMAQAIDYQLEAPTPNPVPQ